MKAVRLLLLLVSFEALVLHVCSLAPDDGDRECLFPTSFRVIAPTYDDTQRPLLDSRHYETLFGSGGVWRTVEYDTNGGNWAHGLGGICNYQVRSCTNRLAQPQQNILVTQSVANFGCNEILIDIVYRFSSGGYTRAFDVLVFQLQGNDHMGSLDIKSNYKVIRTVETSSSSGKTLISFKPDSTKDRFYIGIRENGTCLTINRLLVYCYRCPQKVDGLISYPDTFAPSSDSGTIIGVDGDCLPHSSVDNGAGMKPQLHCSAFGRWISTPGPGCECDLGYYKYNSEGGSYCGACSNGTFKDTYSNEDNCLQCPDNSESEEGYGSCNCKSGYFRADEEGPRVSCTAPPSAPASCRLNNAKNTSLVIDFEPPESDGGRTDVFYEIYYQKMSQLHLGFEKAFETREHRFTLGDLDPVTEYKVRIVAENGVSSKAADDLLKDLRTHEIIANTTEGVPKKITVFARRRGSTFTWQPPTITNGQLTGFCMRIFREGKEEEAVHVELDTLEFCYTPEAEKIPPGSGPVYVQVQAKTNVGGGEWSERLPLETVDPQCLSLENPSNGKVEVSSQSVGARATYACDRGFDLIGQKDRTCLSNGTWSGSEPECVATQCPTPTALLDGGVTYTGTNFGSLAVYTCDSGYELRGTETQVCEIDGSWSDNPPSCEDVNECASSNGGCQQTCTNTAGSFQCSCRSGFTLSSDGKTCDATFTTTEPPIGAFFRLGDKVYQDGDTIPIDSIGEGDNALLCVTDRVGCCSGSGRAGEFSYPDGSLVPIQSAGDGFYRNRGNQLIRLNRRQSTTSPTGQYSCHIPTADDEQTTIISINLVSGTDIDECASGNGGCEHICTNTVSSFQCSCRNGYTLGSNGQSCDDVNECSVNNGGCQQTCTNNAGSFQCSCRSGFTLDGDERTCRDINECASSNGGCEHTCTNTAGSFQCSCRSGFILNSDGRTCRDINECASNNGGCEHTCTNTAGSFQCSCRFGFILSGDGRTCDDLNECASSNGGCQHTCTNTAGSFQCSCRSGFTLNNNRRTCDATQCPTPTALLDGGVTYTGTNFGSLATYTCDNGYELRGTEIQVCEIDGSWSDNPPTCEDVNECASSNGGCQQICTNTPGSFQCSCRSGFTLSSDGKTCDDTATFTTAEPPIGAFFRLGDEVYQDGDSIPIDNIGEGDNALLCVTDRVGCCSGSGRAGEFSYPDGSLVPIQSAGDGFYRNRGNQLIRLNRRQSTTSPTGQYSCHIPTADDEQTTIISINLVSDTDINECASGNGGCEHICTNTVSSFQCSCRNGYTLGSNGQSCDDVNECSVNNGGCQQTCTNTPGSFQCSCRSGFVLNGDGRTCDDINECASSNGGCQQICTNTAGSFQCSCPSGFSLNGDGRTCRDINECASSNGGCEHTCTNTAGSFQCSCRSGFTLSSDGKTCDAEPAIGAFFRLDDKVYQDGDTIPIDSIGEGDNALLCVTDRVGCCSGSGRAGEFSYPDGSRVPIQSAEDGFYRNRGNQLIRLNRRQNTTSPTGQYSCHIPTADGVQSTISINLVPGM